MKKLSALVSLYNSGEWIENRLNNLLQSDMASDTDIWCINANSPDPRDDEIPRKFGVKYIKLAEHCGVYAAWNHAIKQCNSQYLTNANTDDINARNCYSRLTTTLDKAGGRGFAYPNWYVTGRANQAWETMRDIDVKGGSPGQFAGDISAAGVGHFPLWSKCLHNELGLFDERFRALGDVDWWSRCYHVGNAPFVWVQAFLGCYLWRGGDPDPSRHNLWHRAINADEWELFHKKLELYRQHKLS